MGYRKDYFKDSTNKSSSGWYKCPKCERSFRKSGMDVDHIVPQSYGGSNSLDNLQLLCASCNRSKRNSTNDVYDDYKRNLKRRDAKGKASFLDLFK